MLSLAVFLPIVCGLLLLLLGRSVGHRMRQVLVETVHAHSRRMRGTA